MERWRGRTALVTGASSGIGAAVARTLAEAGMRVAVCARRLDRLEALAAEVDGIHPYVCDLRDEASVLALFEAVDASLGGVDVLVNNAGLGWNEPLVSGSTEAWREMLDVNVLALAVCTREALARMAARGVDDGHVIHVSSMSAHRVPGGSGMYAATKYAVRALTEGLRKELREAGSDVRVTALSPGFVETEFAEKYHRSADKAEETYSRYPVLQAVDVADAVRWVLAAPPRMEVHDVLFRPTRQDT